MSLSTARRQMRDDLCAAARADSLCIALPSVPYQYAEWKSTGSRLTILSRIADHYYSVPSRLVRERA